MASHPADSKVRRSVVLPVKLVEEVRRVSAPELRSNLNRLVVVALEEYSERRRREAFERAMDEMAKDPAILRESRLISAEFRQTDGDGLHDGPTR